MAAIISNSEYLQKINHLKLLGSFPKVKLNQASTLRLTSTILSYENKSVIKNNKYFNLFTTFTN